MTEELLYTSPPIKHGFLVKEISNQNLIAYSDLSILAGVSVGNSINEGGGWLHFRYQEAELIVAKKNIKVSISWDQLNDAGCIFGEKIVEIMGVQYRVTVLKGADTDPCENLQGNYLEGTNQSEWADLFYPIVRDDPYIPSPPMNLGAPYTIADLQMNKFPFSWCQENHKYDTGYKVLRGNTSCSRISRAASSNTLNYTGWRPVLRLIQE